MGQEDSLEKKMTTHSSVLAWRIPWTEEPGGLQSMRSQKSDMTGHVNTHRSYPHKELFIFRKILIAFRPLRTH